jgi:hypothetical protein
MWSPHLRPEIRFLLPSVAGFLMRDPLSESESCVTTDGQSASLTWSKTPIWGLRPDFYYCQKVAGLLMWGALWREDGYVVYNYCWPSPAQSFLGPSSVGLPTIFYCLKFETSFSSPPTTRRATVEVHDPASTWDALSVEVKVMLWPTVSPPVCLGIKHSSRAYDQIFITVRHLQACWCAGLSLTRVWVCRLPESQSAVIGLLSIYMYNLHFSCYKIYVYTTYTRPLSVKVKVTLRLTVGQSVLVSYCLTVTVLSSWGALSDERTDLSLSESLSAVISHLS